MLLSNKSTGISSLNARRSTRDAVLPTRSVANISRGKAASLIPISGGDRRQQVIVHFRDDKSPDLSSAERSHVQPIPTGQQVPVMFELTKACPFGKGFGVCGSVPELGNWDTSKAVPLKWSAGDVWYAVVSLPADANVEFKFVNMDISKGIAFCGWANDVTGDKNMSLHIHANAQLKANGTVVRVMDASPLNIGDIHPNASDAPPSMMTSTTGMMAPPPAASYVPPTIHTTTAPLTETASPASAQYDINNYQGRTHGMADIGGVTSGYTADIDTHGPSIGQRVGHAAEVVGDSVRGAAGKVRDTLSSVTHRQGSTKPDYDEADPANQMVSLPHKRDTKPDYDYADPANQMVTLPRQAHEPSMARHIASDSITTDARLAGAPEGTELNPAELSYIDRSSIDYRPEHPEMRISGGGGAVPTDYGVSPTPTRYTADDVAASYPAGQTTPAVTGPDAATTQLQNAGLEMPVSNTVATASSILGNIIGGDEEFPEAMFNSGVTPTTGIDVATAGHASNPKPSPSPAPPSINPRSNPIAMAASLITRPVGSLFSKVSDLVTGSPAHDITTPEEEEARLHTFAAGAERVPVQGTAAAAPTQLPYASSTLYVPLAKPSDGVVAAAGEGRESGIGEHNEAAPESGTQRGDVTERSSQPGEATPTSSPATPHPSEKQQVEQQDNKDKDDIASAPESGSGRQ